MRESGKRTGILGGTFNPVHIGHIRHALEVGEALGLDQVLLTPAAIPPHKSGEGLLPFELRVELVREAVRDVPLLGVNTLEGELHGPSYTWLSLAEWRRRNGGILPWFLMGMEDFTALHTWHRGLELPCMAHLVVVPREGTERELFRATAAQYWPGAGLCFGPVPELPCPGCESVQLPQGGMCTFLPVPRLDISASFIRERWRARRELHGLVPDAVLRLLKARRDEVECAWA